MSKLNKTCCWNSESTARGFELSVHHWSKALSSGQKQLVRSFISVHWGLAWVCIPLEVLGSSCCCSIVVPLPCQGTFPSPDQPCSVWVSCLVNPVLPRAAARWKCLHQSLWSSGAAGELQVNAPDIQSWEKQGDDVAVQLLAWILVLMRTEAAAVTEHTKSAFSGYKITQRSPMHRLLQENPFPAVLDETQPAEKWILALKFDFRLRALILNQEPWFSPHWTCSWIRNKCWGELLSSSWNGGTSILFFRKL